MSDPIVSGSLCSRRMGLVGYCSLLFLFVCFGRGRYYLFADMDVTFPLWSFEVVVADESLCKMWGEVNGRQLSANTGIFYSNSDSSVIPRFLSSSITLVRYSGHAIVSQISCRLTPSKSILILPFCANMDS